MAIKIKEKAKAAIKENVQVSAQSVKRATKSVIEDLDTPEAEPSDDELPVSENVIQPVMKAVRAKCLDCCCGSRSEVRRCIITDCSLHPYRMGNNPFSQRGKTLTEEQKAERTERMREVSKKYWANKKKEA